MNLARTSIVFTLALAAAGCGGSSNKPADNAGTAGNGGEMRQPTQEEIAAATKPCGDADKVHTYDLHDPDGDQVLAPCAKNGGGGDYSGLVKLETVEGGVHIIIDARDDEVHLLGNDVTQKDAVVVYPKGDKQKGVEVPLVKTPTGYHGDKIVFWEDLGKLTDEGTQLNVAIFDHDKTSGTHEELHVSVNISAGKSCERAQDENPQTVDMGKKASKDLTDDQLGAPIKTTSFMQNCNLPDSADADICVAVKNGKPLGVTVNVTPSNNKLAACIDKDVRRLSFPVSDKLDVVHQKF